MLREKSKKFADSLTHFGEYIISLFSSLNKQFFSKQMAGQITGIDINSDFIKLFKLNVAGNRYRVDCFSVLPLPKGAVIKNEIKDPQAIAKILLEAVAEIDMNTKLVALAVNRSAAIIKTISVDNRLSTNEIESRVWIEANRLFPNLVSDIYLDFAIVGPSAQDTSQLEVILVACRKEQMKPYLEIMRLTDLTPKVIDVNCYAFERALAIITKPYPDLETVALLNLDFSLITLIVIQDKALIYTHELSYDGHSLLEQNNIREKNETEHTIERSASDQSQLNGDVLMTSIGLHLRHSMQFFYSSKPHTTIQKIILCGDCVVYFPNLAEFIQKEIGIEVIIPDLFKELMINPKIDQEKLKYHGPQLILSCGLALSKLN